MRFSLLNTFLIRTMKKYWFISTLFALALPLISGQIHAVSSAAPAKSTWQQSFAVTSQNSNAITLPQGATALAINIPKNTEVFIAFPGEFWQKIALPLEEPELEMIPDAPDFAPAEDLWSTLTFAKEPFQELRFRVESKVGAVLPAKLNFAFYDTRVVSSFETLAAASTLPTSGPKIISRAAWGADESLRYTSDPVDSSSASGDEGEIGTSACRAAIIFRISIPMNMR